MVATKDSQLEQIIQHVLIEPTQALRVEQVGPVTVTFEGGEQEVEISADDGDNITIRQDGNDALVDVDGNLHVFVDNSPTITIPPSTDFEAQTQTVTTTPAALSFAFSTTSVLVKALPTNPEAVKIGKSNVLLAYYLLAPGEAITLPVANSSSPVYYVRDTATGTAQITVLAAN